MKYALAQQTRIGARAMNEDRIGCWSTPAAVLMAVADGLGGHDHGEVAAEIAVSMLGAAFQREALPRLADPAGFLERGMAAGHAAIVREAQSRRLAETPRTCLVACVVQDGHAHWTHIGDTRLYHIRGGRILRRTRDHTVVQQLIDEGRIREEAASSHPERNRLLQCLGGYRVPQSQAPESARLAKDDVLILCSDGFWGPLTQRQLVLPLLARPLEPAIEELVALAEARSGAHCDNVSVVAMTWGETEVAASEQSEPRTEVRDFTATDLDYMRTSDEDIAKAIAELKAALRRGSQ
jgi:serine/threonine protein phosphatase PrpC